MKAFWNTLGRALATVAKYAGDGALWASQHPTVVAKIATLAGKPEVAAFVMEAAPAEQAVGTVIDALKKHNAAKAGS